MNSSIARQIADMQSLSFAEMQQLWRKLYGKEPPAFNKPYLVKRLAYRIQELAYRQLSGDAYKKMDEILDTHRFDCLGSNKAVRAHAQMRKDGLPATGTKLVREWNGEVYEVSVVNGGFEYDGCRHRSLTAVAHAITGTHWNGRAFFGLSKLTGKVV